MKIFSTLSHCVLTFLFTLVGNLVCNKGGGVRKDHPLDSDLYSKVQIDNICTFIAAIQRSSNENSCQMKLVARWTELKMCQVTTCVGSH